VAIDGSLGPSLDPAPGRLLVAGPALVDPNFARTIVLLLDTGDDGALGVVLNRPTELPVAEVLSGWTGLLVDPPVLFQGGPVETDSALGVAQIAPGADPVGWRPLFASTGLVDLDTPVELLGGAVTRLRIFAGYAGWSAAQLEGEIGEGAWYVVPAEPEDAFEPDPAALWTNVLRRQGGRLAMLATMPAEPGLN
jgi:putative transcriptional regulator